MAPRGGRFADEAAPRRPTSAFPLFCHPTGLDKTTTRPVPRPSPSERVGMAACPLPPRWGPFPARCGTRRARVRYVLRFVCFPQAKEKERSHWLLAHLGGWRGHAGKGRRAWGRAYPGISEDVVSPSRAIARTPQVSRGCRLFTPNRIPLATCCRASVDCAACTVQEGRGGSLGKAALGRGLKGSRLVDMIPCWT